MIHLITYADKKYEKAKYRIIKEAKDTKWFNTIKGYSPDDLSDDFKEKNKEILSFKRGAGYWIWKYYIIKKRLHEIQDNDVLIYLDAGCTINKHGKKRFYKYLNMLNDDNPLISFQTSHLWLNDYKHDLMQRNIN